MKDRIRKIIESEGMTATKFAEEIGTQSSAISHLLSGRNNPSLDIIKKILERFRGINYEWLISGRGEMYKDYGSNMIKRPENDLFSNISPKEDSDSNADNLNLHQTVNNNLAFDELNYKEKSEILDTPKETFLENNTTQNQIKLNLSKKTAEKIIVFYSDKTFDIYMPNN